MDRYEGPSPFELADMGPLRRPPKDWLPARAMPVEHRVRADPYSGGSSADGGASSVETSTRLHVTWEVHIPGMHPYQFSEVRKSPMWVQGGGPVGTGNRWYKLRARQTHGLMASVGVPCYVDPQNGSRLWVDWDAAYEEHVPAWDRHSALEREVASRQGTLDRVMNRISNPLAGKLAPEEQHLADQHFAEVQAKQAALEAQQREQAEARMAAMGFGAVPEAEQQAYAAHNAEAIRLHQVGREVAATVAAISDTGRKLSNIPVYDVHLDVYDGPAPRRVVLQQPMGPRHAKGRYKQGKRIKLRVDPANPDNVALG